jgi:hypothetical protein
MAGQLELKAGATPGPKHNDSFVGLAHSIRIVLDLQRPFSAYFASLCVADLVASMADGPNHTT